MTQQSTALADIYGGLANWRLWALLGWQDIRQRYRRSLLGPFWLTLSMAVLVGSLGFLYGALFRIAIDHYLPFLTLGFMAWSLISGIINEGCAAFITAEHMIKQIRNPFSLFIYQLIWRNLIVFAHNFLVYVVVAAVFGIWPGAPALLVLPGLVIIIANGAWAGLLLAMVSARFRDIPQIVSSLLQVAFFLTPIIWMPQQLGVRIGIAQANPFFHFVELVRAPLLGSVPAPTTWIAVLTITVAGWLVTYLVFRRFRRRISYWI